MVKLNKKLINEMALEPTKHYTFKECADILGWTEYVLRLSVKEGKLSAVSDAKIEVAMFFAFISEFADTAQKRGKSVKNIASMINSDVRTVNDIIQAWNQAGYVMGESHNTKH